MPNVLITARYFAVDPEPLDLLRRNGCVITHPDIDWTLGDGNVSQARAIELLHDADGAIISSMPITAAVLDEVPRLKVIALRGVGYDSVDVAAATARGIPVAVAPGFTDSVADYVFGLLLAATRQVAQADRVVRGGRWEVLVSTNIAGKTLGIIGLGRIGKAVARRARGFDMPILATDVVQDEAFAASHGVRYVTLEELLRQADIVSINAPLQGDTRHLIDAQGPRLNEADGVFSSTRRAAIWSMKPLWRRRCMPGAWPVPASTCFTTNRCRTVRCAASTTLSCPPTSPPTAARACAKPAFWRPEPCSPFWREITPMPRSG